MVCTPARRADAAPVASGWARRLRAIWVDGPTSEASRAVHAPLDMMDLWDEWNTSRIWVDGPDSEAARAGRATPRRTTGYDRFWASLCWTGDAYDEETAGWPSEARLACRTPDPTHTPAVRRVVAWEVVTTGRLLPESFASLAYEQAAGDIVDRAFRRGPYKHGRDNWSLHWPWGRIRELAAYLRRRDEEAGYR